MRLLEALCARVGEHSWIEPPTVGDASVIGAGSVVTRDVPPGVLTQGNPCRVVRSL